MKVTYPQWNCDECWALKFPCEMCRRKAESKATDTAKDDGGKGKLTNDDWKKLHGETYSEIEAEHDDSGKHHRHCDGTCSDGLCPVDDGGKGGGDVSS